jgi:ABC-type multidrug transport system ATPase subunit
MNVLQSTCRVGRARLRAARRARGEADPAEPVVLLEHTRGHITLEDVSFRYLPDTPLIEDLTLDVKPGETVAIVGPTGAGKTTLVNLLLRFYEIDHGRITRRRRRHHDMTRSDLRACSAWCCRTPGCSAARSATTSPTVARARPRSEIRAAAKAARVDHFVRTLPDGYDTVLDDDATAVSQGEKQLLTIARAFLADPDILILDEATSSVDTRTEVLIQQAMAELMKDRTSFVIAHRLSTIRGADIILVMDHGAHHRAGFARGAAGRRRLLLRPLQQPVRGGARQLHALAAHLLDEDGEMQLAAARDLDAVGAAEVFDAQRDVDAQLALETVLDLAQGHGAAVLAGERAVVDEEEHAHRGLFDLERRQRRGRLESGAASVSPMADLVGPASQTMSPATISSTARFSRPRVTHRCVTRAGVAPVSSQPASDRRSRAAAS